MDTEHTLSLITDYALGLLAAEERRRVEAHARLCPACRAALQREQRVGALLRDAARAVTPVSYTHLDVYKRQWLGGGCCAGEQGRAGGQGRRGAGERR